jgi:hypothetical protein
MDHVVNNRNSVDEDILRFFRHEHLPEHLQDMARLFRDVAVHVGGSCPPSHERTKALDALLVAKDAAVRAKLGG